MIGIRDGMSIGSKTFCNTITKCGPALMFDAVSERWVYNNDMYNSEHGVYLNNGYIGNQISGQAQLNKWHGLFSNHFYSWNSFGIYSPFYFQNGTQGTALWPTPLISTFNLAPASSIIAQSGIYSAVWAYCYENEGNEQTGGNHEHNDSLFMLQNVRNMINHYPPVIDYKDETDHLREFIAYSTVRDNSWIMADPDINTYITTNSSGNFASLYKCLDKINAGDYTGAKNELNAVTMTNNVDNALIVGYRTYIALTASSEDKRLINSLPAVKDLMLLQDLAGKCIFQYNRATLTARNILNNLLGMEFESPCEYNAPRLQQAPAPKPEINVFPNPASNQINVEMLYVNEGYYTFSLMDIAGKKVYSYQVYSGGELLTLPYLPSGLYIYTVGDQQEILFNGKIIINQP
jgi:hypothetical protein